MQYIILIAIFLALGVVIRKGADVVKNLLSLTALVLVGAFVWYKILPNFIDIQDQQKIVQKISNPSDIEMKNADIAEIDADEVQDKSAAFDVKAVEFLESTGSEIQQKFIEVVNQKIKETQQQFGQKIANADIPTLPTQKDFEDMTLDQKNAVKNSILSFFADVPDSNIDDPDVQDAVPGKARVLSQGVFTDEMARESASGLVTIYELENGDYMIRLEEFEVSNGPDLELYLAKLDPSGESVDVNFEFISPLSGNKGSQNYDIPSEIRIENYHMVVIYSPTVDEVYAATPLR